MVRFSMLGDTLSFITIGDWSNMFDSPNDSLLIFATEHKGLVDFFGGKIDRDSIFQIFKVTYKNILDNNWTITISKTSNRF